MVIIFIVLISPFYGTVTKIRMSVQVKHILYLLKVVIQVVIQTDTKGLEDLNIELFIGCMVYFVIRSVLHKISAMSHGPHTAQPIISNLVKLTLSEADYGMNQTIHAPW